MATMVKSFSIQGIDGYPVDIETTTIQDYSACHHYNKQMRKRNFCDSYRMPLEVCRYLLSRSLKNCSFQRKKCWRCFWFWNFKMLWCLMGIRCNYFEIL